LRADTGAKGGATVRIPPPLPYITSIVAGIGVHELLTPVPVPLPMGLRIALALVLALIGTMLTVGALKLFRTTGQDPRPWLATPEIVTTGVYRFTRNPMYVGFALLQVAIGIGLGNLWVLLLAPLACAVVQVTAIRPEEVYLQRKFGDAYLDYKKSVRRWL
jgi:protein-S-isoprenylcysteine O-methyltransferase Ste14